jgi:tRNA U34 5-methylaminomethyl-2-thiouridine-forming methyltransferase MnmC
MKYRIIQTDDGTPSLFSEEYGEAMHSTSGAYQEALFKHVYPSGILDMDSEKISVLDIGFGMGYNSLALIEKFMEKDDGRFLDILAFERDLSYVPAIEGVSLEGARGHLYREVISALERGEFSSGRFSLRIMLGDARKSLQKMSLRKFDAVFHDPYSPSKNPELWSADFFKKLIVFCHPHCVVTTYSSARQIRMAMVEAGFRIGKGPSVGKKREGTLASINGNIACLGRDEMEKLEADVKSTPYRDAALNLSRDEIIQGRLAEMREKKIKKGLPAR